MEGEIRNFFVIWTIAVASLCYCFTIGQLTSKGAVRLLSILPVIAFFFILPLNLHSIFLGGPTYFFLSWMATFKLFLFSFGAGPLSTHPPISFSHFISVGCLPIKIQHRQSSPTDDKSQVTANGYHKETPSPQIYNTNHKSPLNYATKIMIVATFAPVYDHKDLIHPKLLLLFYSLHMYLGLELLLAIAGALSSSLLGVELEPQFDEPYLSTSLQDFWGRRWNTTVSNILRSTAYDPVLAISTRWIGRMCAKLPAVMTSFLVSGIMHELIFYYIGRQSPTWEPTLFFVLNGFGLAIEGGMKKILKGKLKIPDIVATLLSLLFVLSTGVWLFLPSLVRCGVDGKARTELAACSEFMQEVLESLSHTCLHFIKKMKLPEYSCS